MAHNENQYLVGEGDNVSARVGFLFSVLVFVPGACVCLFVVVVARGSSRFVFRCVLCVDVRPQ